MTINEFKLAYAQINPYMNPYSLDMDAERTNFSFFFIFVFSLVSDYYS